MAEKNLSPMLNAYPDSIGGDLSHLVEVLKLPEMKGVFGSFYILPSLFHTDLDRGFSVIDYGLNRQLVSPEDLEALEELGLNLKLDFILNHASVLSPQFQDLLAHGEDSPYRDFFINWNDFWAGHGTMTEEGYIQPDAEMLSKMFFRKPGLPFLMVRMPDGKDVPYWNTFYQQVDYLRPTVQQLMKLSGLQYAQTGDLHTLLCQGLDEGKKPGDIDFGAFEDCRETACGWLENHREYLGQMDLNIKSPLVWDFYADTLKTLAGYGARIVRLDAFAYAPKEPGEANFLNDPGTWDLLERVRQLAEPYHLQLLPEIHASYQEKIYQTVSRKGYMTYDFFLPGLLIHAIETHSADTLRSWAAELVEQHIDTVNMLGCHDGIPLLDLRGLIPEEEIQKLIEIIVGRGGYIKNLDGQKNMYYQVNATYYSALGEDDRKMLLARAVQLFMPGKPQIWYLDLFAGRNDHEAVKRAGAGGHKEINRTNLSMEDVKLALTREVVQKQLKLLQFRNSCPAFRDGTVEVSGEGAVLTLTWRGQGHTATLTADFEALTYQVESDFPFEW